MWNELKQDEKYEIIRDYVRQGYNNLDDIMDDYNKNSNGINASVLNKKPTRSALEEVINEWYSATTWPDSDPNADY